MKKLLSVLSSTLQRGVRGGLLFVAIFSTSSLWAYDFQSGDLYYNITSSSAPYTVEVTSSYAYSSENYSGLTAATIPDIVTHNGTIYSVTNIGTAAFYSCSSLTSVIIPNSVTSIGSSAFEDCHSLTSVTIGESVTSIGDYAFNNCTSLTSVTIPESVTSIGDYAFNNCTSLTSVTIPNSVTSIGNSAFSSCSSLTSVTIPNSVTSIGNAAFGGCSALTSVTIPNSVTSIGNSAFSGCSALTSVTIPNSVTSIEYAAFYGCSSLTFIDTGNGVTRIGGMAFSDCTSLASINIGNRVTDIGYGAFRNCTNLTSLFLPQSVAHLDVIEGFSHGSVNLTSIDVADNNATYCSIDGVVFSKDQKKLILYPSGRKGSYTTPMSTTIIGGGSFHESPLSSIVMTENVKEIEIWAFEECSSLKSVSIPSSVTTIGRMAFVGCTSLSSKIVLTNVQNIGKGAFEGCEMLDTVVLGDKIEEIGELAFNECEKLYHIYCYAPRPPIIEKNVFPNYNVNLYIPCDYLDNYKYDRVFGSFRYIQCIESEDVTTNDVVVNPGANDVTITWPTESNAETYTIVIKKGNEVFCTLTFNANGQLLNIAFAPGRDGNHPVQYAEQAGNGYRFTVTGLEEGTHYAYNIDVRDVANKTIKSHTGEFTTESMTAVENTQNQSLTSNCQKLLRDGQLLILRDDKTYNIVGQIVE